MHLIYFFYRYRWNPNCAIISPFRKRILTSERILKFEPKVARYRILEEPAHLTVAQMCLAVLLHLDKDIDKNSVEEIPMIHYAAENWVYHTRFGNVCS